MGRTYFLEGDVDAARGQRPVVGELSEAVMRRAKFLPPKDRRLIELALPGRVSRRAIGQLLGIPTGTVSRRVWRLGNRLHDPLVIALIERPVGLMEEYRQLGIEYFLCKQSMSELAEKHQMTRHQVDKAIEFVRGWFRGMRGWAGRRRTED